MSSHDDNSDEIEASQKEQQRLLQEQIDQSNAEIEQKRQAVFDERLNILKSQGAPNWNPPIASSPNTKDPSLTGKKANPLSQTSIGINSKKNPLQQRGI